MIVSNSYGEKGEYTCTYRWDMGAVHDRPGSSLSFDVAGPEAALVRREFPFWNLACDPWLSTPLQVATRSRIGRSWRDGYSDDGLWTLVALQSAEAVDVEVRVGGEGRILVKESPSEMTPLVNNHFRWRQEGLKMRINQRRNISSVCML